MCSSFDRHNTVLAHCAGLLPGLGRAMSAQAQITGASTSRTRPRSASWCGRAHIGSGKTLE